MKEIELLKSVQNEEEIQMKFKNKIREALECIIKYNPYDMLAYFYSDYKTTFFEKSNNIKRWQKSKIIKNLQQLILCIPENEYQKKEFQKEDIDNIENLLTELENYITQYSSISNDKLEKLTEEEKEYIMHSNCFKDCNGKRYDVFEIQHHKDLLNVLEQEFKISYNFELNELYRGIENIKNKFYIEFTDNVNEFKDYIKINKLVVIESGIIELPENIDQERVSKIENRLEDFLKNIFGLELVDLQKITTWTTDFLDIFTNNIGDYKDFTNDITIANWDRLNKKINYNPLIKINNRYYNLLEKSFYDNMDRTIIRGICNKLSSNQQYIRANYTNNAEKIVAGYFNKILINSDVYIKNYYNNNFENDILINYDDNIFIVEVKAGNFTPELAIDDFESHKTSLDVLINKAQDQIKQFEKSLKENNSIEIYDSNNKKIRNKKAIINISENTKIFKIIVTVENFNDIEARADKVKILKLDKNTLIICLDDLRVYSNYFENNPCLFIQYLFQRIKAIGNRNIDLVDELYHLGMYIENNFYNELVNCRVSDLIEEKNIKEEITDVILFGEDWITEIDDYYNSLYFEKKRIKKPERMITKNIKEIIKYCENKKILNNTKLTTFLLNLNYETLEQVENLINCSRDFYKKNNRPKYRLSRIKRER